MERDPKAMHRTVQPYSLRHLNAHLHLHSPFGDDWFAKGAEQFARFFGTPIFLIGQTLIVGLWIYVNTAGVARFDTYPFILLNLAFSLQAAYAAPLILLAQTRQADRDKAHAEADATHREEIALDMRHQQNLAIDQSERILQLVAQNNELTAAVRRLSERIESLTSEIHDRVVHLS